jgi:hypothetical protein
MQQTSQSSNSADNPEYSSMERDSIALFKRILEGRKEMHDYVTSTLKFGGYNYRQLCSIFEITTITVSFFENDKIVIDSPQKTIIFENNKLNVYPNDETRKARSSSQQSL